MSTTGLGADAVPQADLQLERQVLGEIIAFPHAWSLYSAAGLRETDFFRFAHRLVFRAITTVAATGVAPDLVAVGIELRRTEWMKEVNVAYFSLLVDDVVRPTPERASFVVQHLADLAGKRDVMAAAGTGDLAAVAREVDATLSRGTDQRRVHDAAGQLDAIRADVERDKEGRLWLGFPTLDNIIDGIRPGEVFGLMARPGIGKTLVLCHIAQCIAETDFGHVMFSLEMSAAPIVDRLAGAFYGVSRGRLRDALDRGELEVDEYLRAFRRFVLVDAPALDVAAMAAKLRQIQGSALRDVPLRLVTVDHLGLISGDRRMSTYDRVSHQARELKELAKRFNVAVIVAVQVNRESGGDGSKELHLGSARDSGVVEEAMDYLVGMRRLDRSQTLSVSDRERYRDVLFLKVLKHRHGAPDAELAVRIDPHTLRLREDVDLKIHETDLQHIAASAVGRR